MCAFFTAYDSGKYVELGKDYLRKFFSPDSMLNSFLLWFGQRHEPVFVVRASSSFSLLIYFRYFVWHKIEIMFSDGIVLYVQFLWMLYSVISCHCNISIDSHSQWYPESWMHSGEKNSSAVQAVLSKHFINMQAKNYSLKISSVQLIITK